MGVAYFLNSKDLHYENIIASGNSPVLIDHETITSPSLTNFKIENKEIENNNISRTVLETSLLPIKNLGLPLYMYGFGCSELLDRKQSSLTVKLNMPSYKEKLEPILKYEGEFKLGFNKLYKLVLENKIYLISNLSPITKFYNHKIRFINRNTNIYYKILKNLNSPEYLSDSIKYGLKLEILCRAYLGVDFDGWESIVEYERAQMLVDDIPVFFISTQDSSLQLTNNKKIYLFNKSAINNVFNKIKNTSLEDNKSQLELICSSIKL